MRDQTLAGVLTCHHSGVRKWTAGGEATAKIDVRVLREIPEGVEVGFRTVCLRGLSTDRDGVSG